LRIQHRVSYYNHECVDSDNEFPFNRKFRKQEPKWPTGYILAIAAALLLSAISFIGVGAIPQPQQAFAQGTNVTQSADVEQRQIANVPPGSNVDQSFTMLQEQFVNTTGP
jgi:hypothetical protein